MTSHTFLYQHLITLPYFEVDFFVHQVSVPNEVLQLFCLGNHPQKLLLRAPPCYKLHWLLVISLLGPLSMSTDDITQPNDITTAHELMTSQPNGNPTQCQLISHNLMASHNSIPSDNTQTNAN